MAATSIARSGLALVRPAVPEPVDTIDRRVHPRRTLSDLDWLSEVRLKYGPLVSLVDLSAGGIQIESGMPLQPGGVVVVQIAGAGGEVTMPSSVLRCHVARLASDAMAYRTALAFKRPFEEPQRPVERELDVVTSLVTEHARITAALRKLAHATMGTNEIPAAGDAILTATLAMIQSPAGRRADPRFRGLLTNLFRKLSQGIESGTEPDIVLDRLVEQIRRSVPARMIRLAYGDTPVGPQGPDTVYFDATCAGTVIARLVVEFPTNCRLEEWHLQLLKIAAQLVALVGEVATLRMNKPLETMPDAPAAAATPAAAAPPAGPAAPADPQPSAPAAPVPAATGSDTAPSAQTAWVPVVARYIDGRMVKGYCRGFAPARGHLSIAATADAQSSTSSVLLRHLKAVFFVHDLEGLPATVGPTPTARGRSIVVTFMDGEVVRGTTLNYTVEGSGFFLSPHEPRGNNLRIFVVHDAVRHVQFP